MERAAAYLYAARADEYVPQIYGERDRRPGSKAKGKAGDASSAPGEAEAGEPEVNTQPTPPAPVLDGEVGSPNSSPFVRAS